MNLLISTTILASKAATLATRTFKRGGGTALPGLIAETLDPKILAHLTRSLRFGSIIVSGTNGKTTTSRLLSQILKNSGLSIIHNRSGSNLTRGIASTLLQKASLSGKIDADLGLFEVDEAALTSAAREIKPRLLILTNIFRDQLDRYFEIDKIAMRWRQVLGNLPQETIICLNADDPRLATLGKYAKGQVIYFGIKQSAHKLEELPQAADILACPECGTQMTYEEMYLGHQGKYFCGNCLFKRPDLDISASKVALDGLSGLKFELETKKGNILVHLGVPGFYNIYNALAASAGAIALGQSLSAIQGGLGEFKAAFGRIERIPIGEKEILLTLVKNPTGFNEVLRMLSGTTAEHLLLALNDLFADGRDVSWIWDVDMEKLASQQGAITVTGLRAWDLANRLKYAGVNPNLIQVQPDFESALRAALDNTPAGHTLFVLPTYTAMLEIRQILTKMGHVGEYWEE